LKIYFSKIWIAIFEVGYASALFFWCVILTVADVNLAFEGRISRKFALEGRMPQVKKNEYLCICRRGGKATCAQILHVMQNLIWNKMIIQMHSNVYFIP